MSGAGVVCAALLLLFVPHAGAGAWTVPAGHWKVFAGVITSKAWSRFGAANQLRFSKVLTQGWIEYGLTDAFTLVAAPEYVRSDTGTATLRSTSLELGGRLLLTRRLGMVSVQASAKTAGGFGMSTSYGGEAGRQFEMRFLAGNSFKLFARDGFFDVEAAQRWIKRPRPDEVALDATAGLWVLPNDLALLQTFTVISAGGVRPPFEPYRQTKLQLSLVHRFSPRWSLQSGYFITPSGRNTVREQGTVVSLWLSL